MKIICSFLFAFLYQWAVAQNKIVVDITNIKNNKGVCRACLFHRADAFNGEAGEPFQCIAISIRNQSAQVVFSPIPAGTYALFVFHDANNNHKLDKNFMGIPKEGYGASKNKLPFARAPTFDENKFVVAVDTTVHLHITLRNL